MMGLRFSKRNSVKIKNLLPKGPEYQHLALAGEIIIRKDTHFDIPEIEIKIDGYFPSIVRLWPLGREEPETPNV